MSDAKIRTMEEFAAVSGISRPTLSKYFNDPASVRKSTRARIEAAIERFGYRPNIYALNQNRKQTRNIGILVPYLADPFFAEMARHVEAVVIAAGYRPILLSSHGDPAQELENLDSLRDIRPAGVLLAPLGRRSDAERVRAFCEEVTTVLFDCSVEGAGEAFVGSDNDQSVGLIVDRLCDTGEPPAFFEMRDPSNPNALKRREAYARAMTRRGLEPMYVRAEGTGWDFEEVGFRGGLEAIARRRLPTDTVLCSNDRLAIGFLAAAYEKGLRVGRGPGCALRVAGHDDHPFARYTCPRLTTVAQDYEAIARKSAETLLSLIRDDSRAASREVALFGGRLVERASA